MVPFAAKQYLGKDFPTTMQAVEQVHFSWIGPYCPALEKSETPEFTASSNQLLRRMGYQYSLLQANAKFLDGSCTFSLKGANTGVAPFYYPWTVRLALIDTKGSVISQANTAIDIQKWLPGEFSADGTVKLSAPNGSYRLALGVVDPYLKKPAIEFANSFAKEDGWQVLGQVQIANNGSRNVKSND